MKKVRTDIRFKHHEASFFINKLDPKKEKKLESSFQGSYLLPEIYFTANQYIKVVSQ